MTTRYLPKADWIKYTCILVKIILKSHGKWWFKNFPTKPLNKGFLALCYKMYIWLDIKIQTQIILKHCWFIE